MSGGRRLRATGSRRRSLRCLALLAAITLAALPACGGSSGGSSQGFGKGQLTIATTADSQSAAPPGANVATAFPLNPGVFQTLVTISPTFQLRPLLATSWQFRAPNTYRFSLRHDVVFHNGQPFTADSVLYTLQHVWGLSVSNLDLDKNSVRVVDKYTVDITPAHTDRRVLELLANPQGAYIVAPGTIPGDGASPQTTPTGTGPFKFVSYTPKVALTVQRFEKYWGPKAGVGKIIYKYVPDDATRALALRSGEAQMISDVPYGSVAQLAGSGQTRVVRSPVASSYMLMVNLHGKPPYDLLNDLPVRQALAYSLSRPALIKSAFDGEAKNAHTYVVPGVLGSYAGLIQGFPNDPNKANQLLDADGWKPGPNGVRVKDGRPLTLTLIGQSSGTFSTLAQLIKAEAAKVGINIELSLNSQTFLSRQRAGTLNIALWQLNQNDASPTYQLRFLTDTDVAFFGVHYYAAGPDFEKLFSDATATGSIEAARKFTAQALHVALDQTVSAVPLAGAYQIWAMAKDVQGFQPLGAKSDQTFSSVRLGSG